MNYSEVWSKLFLEFMVATLHCAWSKEYDFGTWNHRRQRNQIIVESEVMNAGIFAVLPNNYALQMIKGT